MDEAPYRNTIERLKAALEEAKQSEKVAEASVELARAGLTRTEANLKFATDNRDRNAELFETKAASRQDLDVSLNRFA